MFNPELCRDKNDKSNADKIAELGLFYRAVVKIQNEMVNEEQLLVAKLCKDNKMVA
jgi:hypothetical protein